MSRAQDAQERPRYRIAVGPQQGRKVFTLQTLLASDAPFDGGVGKLAGFSLLDFAGMMGKREGNDQWQQV